MKFAVNLAHAQASPLAMPARALRRVAGPAFSRLRCQMPIKVPSMRLALFEPDIPQNTGTMLRLAACLSVAVDVIGPTGFDMTDRTLRRAGLDYLAHADISRHDTFDAFDAARVLRASRLVLLTTHSTMSYVDFAFRPDDTLLVGRESAGVPDAVHEAADARLRIPMRAGLRSLNVAVAAALVLGEALRQTGGFTAPE
jgi:tRNA (cytidine/uridine-2'-O-)-methyltransferase